MGSFLKQPLRGSYSPSLEGLGLEKLLGTQMAPQPGRTVSDLRAQFPSGFPNPGLRAALSLPSV